MKKEIKIGFFVILVLIAAFFTIEFLKGKSIFSTNNTFYARYERVDGLDPSTYVTIKGFKAGKISEIKFNRDKRDYTVAINVSKDFKIPKDSYMEIYNADLIGSKAVDLILGESETFAKSGDTLAGNFKKDVISTLISEILPLKDNVEELVINMNKLTKSVNDIVNENAKKEIDTILSGIKNSVNELYSLVSAVNGKAPQIDSTLGYLNSLANSLNASSAYFTSAISNIDSISNDIKNSQLKTAIDSLKSLIIKIQDPNGTAGKLITSDSLYNSITSLSNNLKSLIQHIEENPKKYLKFSIF